MAYLPGTITVSDITDVSVVITVVMNDAVGSDYSVSFSLSATGQTTVTPTVTVPSGETTGTATVTGLASSTEYTLTASSPMNPGPTSQTFTTKATGYNSPKVATQEQWEDLATRVKSAGSGNANITMTMTDPGEGSALSANNYVAVYGGDPIIMDYSTTETNTGAKWIDGSTIYKKTVSTGALPNTGTSTIDTGISNVALIIKFEGYCTNGVGAFRPLPCPTDNGSGSVRVDVNSYNSLRIITGSDWSSHSGYVTLYYTKSSS